MEKSAIRLGDVIPVRVGKGTHPIPLVDHRGVDGDLQNGRRKGYVPWLHPMASGQLLVFLPELSVEDGVAVHVCWSVVVWPVKVARRLLALGLGLLPGLRKNVDPVGLHRDAVGLEG